MPAWLLWLLGAVAMLGEGPLLQFLGAEDWALQIAIPCALYAGLRRPFTPGATLLALWLPLADWASMCPGGMHTLGLVTLFVLCRLIEPWIDVSRWSLFHGLLCALAAFIHHAVIAAVLLITQPDSPALLASLITSPAAMVFTAAAGWPLGWALARLDRWFEGRQRSQGIRL
jgi:hypothetical protein